MTDPPSCGVSWRDFAAAEPALADAIHARFVAHTHHVLATLHRDGAPRVSGTEVDFRLDEALLGSMYGARKAHDLQRDPRFALHSHTGDSTMDGGDAKLAGLAVEILDTDLLARFVDEAHPPEPFHLFRLEITHAVLTTVDGTGLVVSLWRAGHGATTVRRQ
jgi:hypothetical protein